MGSSFNRMLFICCLSTTITYGLFAYKLSKRKNSKSTAITVSSKIVPETVSHLPVDIIIYEILPFLKVKDLLRYKTVCKQWKTLIDEALTQDPYFPHKFSLCKSNTYTCHYLPYSLEERNEKNEWVLGTCNGLDFTMKRNLFPIGIFNLRVVSWTFYIKNSETHQVLRLPWPESDLATCKFAFAFISNTNEYKLANIRQITKTKRQCAVLTLGGSGEDQLKWRYIVFPDSKKKIVLTQDKWVVQAGAVVHCMNYIDYAYEIMSIDLESEDITETHVCLNFFIKYSFRSEFTLSWNGYLAFLRRDRPDRFDVWVLEDFKKNKWSNRFSVWLTCLKEFKSDDFFPIVAQDGLLWLCSVDNEKVIGYDIKTKRIAHTFIVPKELCQTSIVFCHVPSLASLKGMEAAYP